MSDFLGIYYPLGKDNTPENQKVRFSYGSEDGLENPMGNPFPPELEERILNEVDAAIQNFRGKLKNRIPIPCRAEITWEFGEG